MKVRSRSPTFSHNTPFCAACSHFVNIFGYAVSRFSHLVRICRSCTAFTYSLLYTCAKWESGNPLGVLASPLLDLGVALHDECGVRSLFDFWRCVDH